MDAIVLKSFLPEIFFSMAILFQIIWNTRKVNDLILNFPRIEREVFYQTLYILVLLCLFLYNLRMEGYLSTYTLLVDSGITFTKLFFIIICIITIILVYQAQNIQKINFPEYFTILLLSILGLLLMISSCDLLVFYLAMETQALCFYVLGSSNRSSIFSIEAGIKYFISGSFMSGVYLLGVSLIYAALGTINLNDIAILCTFDLNSYSHELNILFIIGAILVLSTILFKIACAPFHFWSPDVYDGAPLYSTVIFSVVPKIPLYFFFVKFVNSLVNAESFLSFYLLFCGVLSVFLGTFFAFSQKRLKRLIVYSSVAQTGFLVAGISVFSLDAYSNSFFFLILYLITSLLVWGHFVVFYNFSNKMKSFYIKEFDSLYISTLHNLSKYNPTWALSFVIIFFSIGGIPPLTGFLSKMLIIFNLVNIQHFFFAITLVVISSVSVYYYIRILKVIYFEPKAVTSSQEFKVSFLYDGFNIVTLVFILMIMILILAFYNPSFFLLASQKISLSTYLL